MRLPNRECDPIHFFTVPLQLAEAAILLGLSLLDSA